MSKCETCKHDKEPWHSETCDGCTRANSNYEADLISREEIEWHPMMVADGDGMYHEEDVAYRSQIGSLPSAVCDDCIWHVCNYNKVDWDGKDGYISKRDAIDAIAKFVPYVIDDISTESYTNGLRDAYNLIYQLPSVDRPTGKWVWSTKEINDCDGHRAYYWYECDNCGARPPKDQWGNEWHSDFCPNCGCAMMEGGDTE